MIASNNYRNIYGQKKVYNWIKANFKCAFKGWAKIAQKITN